MDNQNTTPTTPTNPIQSPTTPNVVPSTPTPVTPVPPTPKPVFKFDVLVTNLKLKYNGLPQRSKIILIALPVAFLVLLIVLSLIVGMLRRGRTPTLNPTPTPINSSPAPDVILNASRYATDEGVLKIESNLHNIQKELNTTDVKQGDLVLPTLDFNITFNQ